MYSYSIHGPCKCSVIRMNLENVFRQNNMKHLGAGLDFTAICKDNNRIFFHDRFVSNPDLKSIIKS